MTSAQAVETFVVNNSSFQNYPHPVDHTIRTTNIFEYVSKNKVENKYELLDFNLGSLGLHAIIKWSRFGGLKLKNELFFYDVKSKE